MTTSIDGDTIAVDQPEKDFGKWIQRFIGGHERALKILNDASRAFSEPERCICCIKNRMPEMF